MFNYSIVNVKRSTYSPSSPCQFHLTAAGFVLGECIINFFSLTQKDIQKLIENSISFKMIWTSYLG